MSSRLISTLNERLAASEAKCLALEKQVEELKKDLDKLVKSVKSGDSSIND